MTIMSRIAALLVLLATGATAVAEGRSAWVQGLHSRVRLIAAGTVGGDRLAGIEIALDKGFKTYWRQPGESGLPPRFDWNASSNVGAVDVLWPAPHRHEDAGGVAYVYVDRVVLPVRVRPADPDRPVSLRLALDYGVCKEICIPARAELAATLLPGDGGVDRADGALVRLAGLARVPKPAPFGAPGPLAIVAAEAASAGGKPALRVTVRGPADATLFADGPEDWFVSTSAPRGDGTFTVVIEERPRAAKGPVDLRLTLVAGTEAVETELHLDEALRPR